MTDDLVQFIRDRYDEEAQAAEAAAAELGADWYYDSDGSYGSVLAVREDDVVATGSQDFLEPERGVHIARHDPARVLAEVEAKRRIVGACAPPLVDVRGLGDSEPQYIPGEGEPWGLPVLRLLALPYADHPKYKEKWRP